MIRSRAALLGFAFLLSVTGASSADVIVDTVERIGGGYSFSSTVPSEEACLRLGRSRHEMIASQTTTRCVNAQTGQPMVEQSCRSNECVSKRLDGAK